MERIFWIIWAVAGLIMLLYYAKRKHAFISALFGMGTGAAALIVCHYYGGIIDFQPQLNMFNTMTSLIFGIWGVFILWLTS